MLDASSAARCLVKSDYGTVDYTLATGVRGMTNHVYTATLDVGPGGPNDFELHVLGYLTSGRYDIVDPCRDVCAYINAGVVDGVPARLYVANYGSVTLEWNSSYLTGSGAFRFVSDECVSWIGWIRLVER